MPGIRADFDDELKYWFQQAVAYRDSSAADDCEHHLEEFAVLKARSKETLVARLRE